MKRMNRMNRATLTVLAVSAMVMIGRAAQAPPNLSGTWRPQNPMAGQANPFEFTIAQTPDSVTIRTPLSTPDAVTMKLNGEETRVQIGSGPGAVPATATARATWEGSKLVVMSAVTGGRGSGAGRAAYSLNGDLLTVETSNALADGSMSAPKSTTYVKYTPVPMPA